MRMDGAVRARREATLQRAARLPRSRSLGQLWAKPSPAQALTSTTQLATATTAESTAAEAAAAAAATASHTSSRLV